MTLWIRRKPLMKLHISVHTTILPLVWQLQIAGNHQFIVTVAAPCQMLISVRMRKGMKIPMEPLMIILTLWSLFSQMIKTILPNIWNGHLALQGFLVAKQRRGGMRPDILVESVITPTAGLTSCRRLGAYAPDLFGFWLSYFNQRKKIKSFYLYTICISLSNFSRSRFLFSQTAYTSRRVDRACLSRISYSPFWDKHISSWYTKLGTTTWNDSHC